MQSGEHKLAVHPNCGTNLVTAGFMATVVAWLGFAGRGWRRGWERFPSMMVDHDGSRTIFQAAGHEPATAYHHGRRPRRPAPAQCQARGFERAFQRTAIDDPSRFDAAELSSE